MKAPIVAGRRVADYRLESAILIYGSTRGEHYATAHRVAIAGQGARIGAGKPLTESALRTTLHKLGTPKGLGGWVGARMLYMDDGTIVWHRLSGPRVIFFGRGAEPALAGRGALVMHPHLVFAVTRHAWYVAAVTCDQLADTGVGMPAGRPGPTTPLMRAPYPNVYEDGDICTGNVTLPGRIAPDTTGGFEDAFFDSRFTHSNFAQACAHPQGLGALWRSIFDTRPAEFPDHHLAPMHLTLGQFVERITKGQA